MLNNYKITPIFNEYELNIVLTGYSNDKNRIDILLQLVSADEDLLVDILIINELLKHKLNYILLMDKNWVIKHSSKYIFKKETDSICIFNQKLYKKEINNVIICKKYIDMENKIEFVNKNYEKYKSKKVKPNKYLETFDNSNKTKISVIKFQDKYLYIVLFIYKYHMGKIIQYKIDSSLMNELNNYQRNDILDYNTINMNYKIYL